MTMNVPLTDHAASCPALVTGRVHLHGDEAFTIVLDGGGDSCARRASSCLLAPRTGDRVLLALVPEPYVLAVLERDATREAELAIDGDAILRAKGGTLALEGERGVRVRAKEAVEIASSQLRVASGVVEVVAAELAGVARKAQATFDDVTFVATHVERAAERIVERASRVFRFVSELDQLRARHFDYRAEQTAQVKGEHTVVVAREVVRIDGAQVHIG